MQLFHKKYNIQSVKVIEQHQKLHALFICTKQKQKQQQQ